MTPPGQAAIVLPPLPTAVVVTAAIGMMIVVAPADLMSAVGLRELRQGHDHAFGMLVLVLTAWASGIMAAQLAAYRARQQFLSTVPDIFARLSATQRQWILACLADPDVTLRRNACDSIARSLCELGLLTPPDEDPDGLLRLDAAFTMPPDVAAVLQGLLPERSWPAQRTRTEGRPDVRD